MMRLLLLIDVILHATALSPAQRLTLPRRDAIAAAIALASPATVGAASAAEQQLSELPDGPLQFERFVRVKAEWNRFGKRLADSTAEIDDAEWENVGLFLRRLYNEGDDMIFLSKSLDAEKKAKTKTYAESFRSMVKMADRPRQNKDRTAMLQAYDDSYRILDSFLELLQDIPDEL